MTAIAIARFAASPPLDRTDWQGVRDAIELFILERRADKKQPSTIRYYRQQLGLFCAWLTQQDVSGDGPEDVTKALILAYRLHLQERGHTRLVGQPLQHTTLVASQRARRTFYAWAEEESYVIDGRILKLRKTRVPQKDAAVYTLAQIDAILAACASPTEELAVRLLVGTGVRLSEAVGVCLRGPDGLPDLETDTLGRGCATLRVRWDAGAKGLKTRRTPVALPLMKAIRRYELRERPHVTAPQLLITRRGEPYKTWGLDSVMDRLQERVGFHVHDHAFRHTWASVMVQSGWSLEHVRSFIGHTDYTTLHRYVRLATERDLGDLDRWAQLIPPPAHARFRGAPTWPAWPAGPSLQRWDCLDVWRDPTTCPRAAGSDRLLDNGDDLAQRHAECAGQGAHRAERRASSAGEQVPKGHGVDAGGLGQLRPRPAAEDPLPLDNLRAHLPAERGGRR